MKRRNRIQATLHRAFARALVLCPIVFVLVAGAGCPSLFDSPTQRATHIQQAIAGRNGDFTVTTATTVVNAYAGLDATTNPAAGATTITVADVSTLNPGTVPFTANLGRGDLILIIQMAGATINAAESANYGSFTNAADINNAGHYEFAGVDSVSGNVITLACVLKNSYTGTGKVQIIRVPQFGTLTVNTGAKIIAPAWNGTVGGVVAVHAENTVHLTGTGSIDVSGRGFRGGVAHDSTNNTGTAPVWRTGTAASGAEKGEGIAGSSIEYAATLNGQYGRGAPANGGGGGDSHNAGGGGGSNARSGATWTGQGVMVVAPLRVVGGTQAWPLDPNYTLANTTLSTASEGGGRGGYSYSTSGALSPLTSGPDAAGCAWGGDCRREIGGLGGHALDNSPATRLFMGGGGGAGDGNNGAAGDGGNGGGLIFVIAGKIDGSGKLSADGGIGGSSHGATGTAGDGAGGGGGGGTVVVHAVEIAGTWTITADGGVGGNHTNSTTANEVEGPGGGGGGGYIAVSGGAPTRSAVGALGGTTTVRPSVMSTFPSNGATAGNDGQIDGNADTFNYCGVAPSTTAPVATILTGPTPSTNGSTTSTTATFTFEASEPGITEAGVTLGEGAVALQCKLDSEASVKPCSSGSSGYTASTVLTVGHHTFTVTATDLSGNTSSSVWAWDVVGLGLDGGVLDAQGLDAQIDAQSPALDAGVDGGGLDGSGGEVGPAFLDAQGIDAESDVATSDVSVPGVDGATAKLDVPRDLPGTTNQDTAPFVSVDASVDASATDILLPVLDAGSRSDGPDGLQPLPIDTAGLEALGDATVVVLNPDTAPPNPDLNPDVAPVVIEDASVAPSTKDAAVAPPTDIKVMGSGFCAIASSRSTTSAPFLVMALAALALLRRRRQR